MEVVAQRASDEGADDEPGRQGEFVNGHQCVPPGTARGTVIEV